MSTSPHGLLKAGERIPGKIFLIPDRATRQCL